MQAERIDQQSYECPCLFRVPAPVASPGHIGPDCPGEDSRRKKEHGEIQEHRVDVVKPLHHRVRPVRSRCIAGDIARGIQNQCGSPADSHKCEEHVGNHHQHHVDAEQWGVQHRGRLADIRARAAHHSHEQCRPGYDEKGKGSPSSPSAQSAQCCRQTGA